jgi:hypothetical protein
VHLRPMGAPVARQTQPPPVKAEAGYPVHPRLSQGMQGGRG